MVIGSSWMIAKLDVSADYTPDSMKVPVIPEIGNYHSDLFLLLRPDSQMEVL
jgi:hypothetical protein